MIQTKGNSSCINYHWFLASSEEKIGKNRSQTFLDNEYKNDVNVKAFVDVVNEDKVRDKINDSKRKSTELSTEALISSAKEIKNITQPHIYFRSIVRCFAKEAAHNQLIELANNIIVEPDEVIKSLLLSVFVMADFPLEAKILYPFIENGGRQLAGITIAVLGRIYNKDIHDFAFSYLSNGGKDMRVLDLLVKNQSNQDEELIRKILFKSKIIDHNVQMAVTDFCRCSRSKKIIDILEYLYYNGKCTFCRFSLVEIMYKKNILLYEILNECLYDSNSDIRKWASKKTKRKERNHKK